jgi:hypothetical protein
MLPGRAMISRSASGWTDFLRLEVHDPAALVACCQQLVECSVGIRPEARLVIVVIGVIGRGLKLDFFAMMWWTASLSNPCPMS